ncbi:MAG TPA: hypothetical protein PK711_11690 [Bacteroidales bacterium]|nr:hypothetical protein [Bacteroidales bacterium]
MTAFIYIAIVITGLVFIYLFIIRPWHLKWGATKDEINLELPGDSIVTQPDFNATRGIVIHSIHELIWRWIIQIGSKRAGWYSIDWMDNAGIKSSEKILPAANIGFASGKVTCKLGALCFDLDQCRLTVLCSETRPNAELQNVTNQF